MNDVAIVGTGQTKFSKDDGDVEKILFESTKNCIQSVRNCEPKDIEGVSEQVILHIKGRARKIDKTMLSLDKKAYDLAKGFQKQYNDLVGQRGAIYTQKVREILGEELFAKYLKNLEGPTQEPTGQKVAESSTESVTPEVMEKLRAIRSVNIPNVKLSRFAEWVRKETGLKVTVRTDDFMLTGERHENLPIGFIIRKTATKNGLSYGYEKESGVIIYKESAGN